MSDLIMQNIDVGWIIRLRAGGCQYRVEKILRNPQYDKDGVPCSVEARAIINDCHVSIAFGNPPNMEAEDWRDWTVVSKPS